MNEMVFEGTDALYDYLTTKGGANKTTHGMIGTFYQSVSVYRNPNTCSCRKGPKALNSINAMYSAIHTSLSTQNAEVVRALFDNNTVVLKLDGAEVGRF